MANKPQLLSLTDAAKERVRHLLNKVEGTEQALRVGIKTVGCSGLSYQVEFTSEPDPADEVVEIGDLRVYVDRKATLFLIGSEMDYVEEKLSSGFVFNNPNEISRCGCGESFQV